MKDDSELRAERAELLRLRARIVVVEKMAAAALELALRLCPEELKGAIEHARKGLSTDYEDVTFAPDIVDIRERTFVASEVERRLRGVQADLGFAGGISTPENG